MSKFKEPITWCEIRSCKYNSENEKRLNQKPYCTTNPQIVMNEEYHDINPVNIPACTTYQKSVYRSPF